MGRETIVQKQEKERERVVETGITVRLYFNELQTMRDPGVPGPPPVATIDVASSLYSRATSFYYFCKRQIAHGWPPC
jgi:hypothetical protein